MAIFAFIIIVSFAERLIGTENSTGLRQRDKLLDRLQMGRPIDYLKAERLLMSNLVYSTSLQGTPIEDEVDRFSRQNLAFGLSQSPDRLCNALAKRYFYGSTAAPTVIGPSMLERLLLARLDAPAYLLENMREMLAVMQTRRMIESDIFPKIQFELQHIIDNVMTNTDGSVTAYWGCFRTDFLLKEVETGGGRVLLPKRHEQIRGIGRMRNWRALSGTALDTEFRCGRTPDRSARAWASGTDGGATFEGTFLVPKERRLYLEFASPVPRSSRNRLVLHYADVALAALMRSLGVPSVEAVFFVRHSPGASQGDMTTFSFEQLVEIGRGSEDAAFRKMETHRWEKGTLPDFERVLRTIREEGSLGL